MDTTCIGCGVAIRNFNWCLNCLDVIHPTPWATVKQSADGLYYADVPVNIAPVMPYQPKSYIQVALEGPMQEIAELRLENQKLKQQISDVIKSFDAAVNIKVRKELDRLQREKLGQREVTEATEDAMDKRFALLEIK